MQFGGRCDIGDDEVVASYAVYFASSLAGQTHVFQYPMRARNRPYEATETRLFYTEGARDLTGSASSSSSRRGEPAVIKASSRLTMRHSLDTFGSPNFRRAESVEGTGATSADQPQSWKYEYALYSEPFVPRSDYCVAYFTGNEVHLTPVSTVQRLYPAHESRGKNAEEDVAAGYERAETGAMRVGKQHVSAQAGPVIAGTPVADRFTRELVRQRSVVLNSDANTARELEFHPLNSPESAAMQKRLLSTTKEVAGELGKGGRSRENTEGSLFPPEILVSGGITGGSDRTSKIIRPFASRWSVADQVAQLMMRCQVLALPVIEQHVVKGGERAQLNPSPTTLASEIVDVLRPRAVYMHGVWVNRVSEDFRGATAALREVILLTFYQSPGAAVPRSQLNKLVSSGALRRSIKDILLTIAVLSSDEPDPTKRVWRLRYVPGSPSEYSAAVEAFQKAFPAEAAAQSAAWQKRAEVIMSHLNYINASRVPPQLALESAHSSLGAALPHSATGGFAAHPGFAGSRGAGGGEIRDQDLAPIRQYIRMLFAQHGVVAKQRAKEIVFKAKEAHFPKATKEMLGSAMQSSVQSFTESTWVLKSLGEPTIDKFRMTILQCILELQQFEMVSLQRRVDQVMMERGEFAMPEGAQDAHAVPPAVLKRVVTEVAEFQTAERLWHIKSGNVLGE